MRHVQNAQQNGISHYVYGRPCVRMEGHYILPPYFIFEGLLDGHYTEHINFAVCSKVGQIWKWMFKIRGSLSGKRGPRNCVFWSGFMPTSHRKHECLQDEMRHSKTEKISKLWKVFYSVAQFGELWPINRWHIAAHFDLPLPVFIWFYNCNST